MKTERTAALGTGDHSVLSAGITPLAILHALGVCESRRRVVLCNQGAGCY